MRLRFGLAGLQKWSSLLSAPALGSQRMAPFEQPAEWRRSMACGALALGLHALLTLFGHREPNPSSLERPIAFSVDSAVTVSLDDSSAQRPGALPGGGSEQPEPQATRSSPLQPVKPALRAPRVLRAPVKREAPSVSEAVNDSAEELGPPPSDLLAAAEGLEPLAPTRPRAARRLTLQEHRVESASQPEAAEQQAQNSRSPGYGFGINGGPGGEGHGDGGGLIRRRFAFGGPSGAFRADVCFIDSSIKSLKQVNSCVPVASFYTDVLNVPPRRFNDGFPGFTERSEWFAIKYRGKFKVQNPDYYKFRLLSDDGALLYIDGYKIIDNDGQHMPRSVETTITLEAGEHELYVFYYQGPAEFIALQLFVQPFNGAERLLSSSI